MFYRGLVLVMFLALLGVGIKLGSKKQGKLADVGDETERPIARPKKHNGQRRPASVSPVKNNSPITPGPLYQTEKVTRDIFEDRESINEPETPSTAYGSPSSDPGSAPSRPSVRSGNSPSGRTSSASPATSKVVNNTLGPTTQGTMVLTPVTSYQAPQKKPDSPPQSAPSRGSGRPVNPGDTQLTCSSNIGSGTFSYAFSVTLSCSSAATIRYCISEDTCCDPSTGAIYTGAIPINMGAGNFCLSFAGETLTGVDSVVSNNLYTLNPAVPDLQVAHQKRYFQTTELEGVMNLTSAEFGDPSFSVGILNLKSHDPGPSGMDWDCNSIMADYPTLSAPTPLVMLNDQPADSFLAGTQINVFLRSLNLGYGLNYLTSYVKNNNFVEPVTACSTTPVMLEDFAHFDFMPTQATPGTNDVREYAGGFTHLGFFEPETTLYRGPAGSSSETVSDQEIETNLFGIFY